MQRGIVDGTAGADAVLVEIAEEQDDGRVESSGGKRQRGTSGKAVAIPDFEPISAKEAAGKTEFRRVPIPPHRYTPLRKDWMSIYTPIVEHMAPDEGGGGSGSNWPSFSVTCAANDSGTDDDSDLATILIIVGVVVVLTVAALVVRFRYPNYWPISLRANFIDM